MQTFTRALVNGALSFAISITMVLTVGDGTDRTWTRADIARAAGLSAFFSGVCTSYYGDSWRR